MKAFVAASTAAGLTLLPYGPDSAGTPSDVAVDLCDLALITGGRTRPWSWGLGPWAARLAT